MGGMAKPDAVRITTARSSAAEDMKSRQRRYALSMTIRLVCFVAAVAVGPGPLRWVLVAGAVFLPLFAVVMANAGDQRDDGFTLPNGPSSRELTAGEDEN
jgi:Flp pilus assembly protein TadB